MFPQNYNDAVVSMASSLMTNPSATNSDRARESSRRKKKRCLNARDQTQIPEAEQPAPIPWKSPVQHQVYSSKLYRALKNIPESTSPSPIRRVRAFREAADRVLATAAKGKTRWSRAILTNRLKIKFMKNRRSRAVISQLHKPKMNILALKAKNAKEVPLVQKKTRVLGRLIPGCRKQPLPVVLEEATDYIAALEMQVRAMAVLANLLTGPGESSSPAPALNPFGPTPQT
jgi:hypothetical protein